MLPVAVAHPEAGVGVVPGALHLDVVVCPGAGAVGVGSVRRAADGVRAACILQYYLLTIYTVSTQYTHSIYTLSTQSAY